MAGALSSLKIVEVGEMVSAPYCSKLFADMGADVIKIERPGAGDRSRTRGPFPGDKPNPETSGLFLYLNTNKRGVTLDITQPDGFEIFEKLVASADILIHNVAPPDMDRIGLSYDRMHRVNPKLIMTSILPFGLTGPYRNYRAEDLTIWCAGGVCVLNGGGPEHPVVRAVCDGAVGMVNPFRCKMLYKKASLAVLSDELDPGLGHRR